MFDRWNERLRNFPYLAGALLLLVTFAAFAGTLANGFVYDDIPQIIQNPFVFNPRLWKNIFTGDVWSFLGGHTSFYRPLQFCGYWLVYRLAGPSPGPFHLFSLMIYAATVLLVYRLGRELLQHEVAAFVGALLWALHPLHVETVAWVSALPDVGVGFFYLLGFLLFLRAEKASTGRAGGHSLAALAFFSALFFKEMALSFPLMVLAYGFFLNFGGSWRSRVLRWLPYLLAVVAYVAIRHAVLGRLTAPRQFWKLSWGVAGAALGLLGEHARLFFWPTQLNDFRVFDLGASLRSPWPWAVLLTVLAMVWTRKREPRLSFLVVWWAVALLPCLDVRQLSFPLLSERFSYLPSVGLCLAISFFALRRLPQWAPQVPWGRVSLPALTVLMVLWAVQSVRTIPNWRDNETLMDYSYQQSPNAALLHIRRADILLYRHGDLDGAAREYETAMRLNATSFWPLTGIRYFYYLGLGRIANRQGRTEEAVKYFEKAIPISPANSEAYDCLGSIYFPRRDYAKAAEYFVKAVKANPYDFGARFYLGTCWIKLGKYREAAEQFRAAREVDPSYWQAYEAEARALEAGGEHAAAARVRSLMPTH